MLSYGDWRSLDDKLDLVVRLLREVLKKESVMSAELDALQVQVKANTDAEQSAVTLLGQLSGLIKASVNDPAALNKLASDLDASKQSLAAAILSNTPAGPTPTPPAPAPGAAPGRRP